MAAAESNGSRWGTGKQRGRRVERPSPWSATACLLTLATLLLAGLLVAGHFHAHDDEGWGPERCAICAAHAQLLPLCSALVLPPALAPIARLRVNHTAHEAPSPVLFSLRIRGPPPVA